MDRRVAGDQARDVFFTSTFVILLRPPSYRRHAVNKKPPIVLSIRED